MSHIAIKFNTDNEAFQEEGFEQNVSFTLQRLADDARNGDLQDGDKIYDINGNRVGSVEIVKD